MRDRGDGLGLEEIREAGAVVAEGIGAIRAIRIVSDAPGTATRHNDVDVIFEGSYGWGIASCAAGTRK